MAGSKLQGPHLEAPHMAYTLRGLGLGQPWLFPYCDVLFQTLQALINVWWPNIRKNIGQSETIFAN